MRTATALACTLALLAVPLVGCIGASDEGSQEQEIGPDERSGAEDENEQARGAPDGDGAQAVSSNRIETFAANGSFTAEAYRVGLPGATGEDRPAVTFEAPSDAAQILVEFRWEGVTTTFDLELFSPAFCQEGPAEVDPMVDGLACSIAYVATGEDDGAYRAEGSGASSSGELRLTLDADEIAESSCEEETCEWRAHAFAYAGADVSFEMHVAVAHGAPLPDDYTGLDG